MYKKVLVYGLGNFGYSMLKHLDKVIDYCEYELWGFELNNDVINSFKSNRSHPKIFPDYKISDNIKFTDNVDEALEGVDVLVLAVPSFAIKSVLSVLNDKISDYVIILNLAKALSDNMLPFSTEVEYMDFKFDYDYAMLGGGMIAADFFNGYPLGCTLACQNPKVLNYLASLIGSQKLFVEKSNDVVGVEYAGSFKNIGSILTGYLFGKGYPYGTITYYITRFSEEVKRLVVNDLGGEEKTFSIESQCWGNDYFMSCTGNTRNRQFGELMGQGHKFQEAFDIMKQQNKTVEGINTLNILKKLLEKHGEYNYMLLRSCVGFLDDSFELI